MADKQLLPAILPWVRLSSVSKLTENLEKVLRQHQETQDAHIQWRPDSLTDFRPLYVPAAAERLVRWDTRGPDDVFTNGFAPQADKEWAHDQMDLWTYVQQNVPSIFVSTARYYRSEAGAATRWMPLNRASVFEYEVLAPGGIDVNLCLGQNHCFPSQRMIAFPGGIRREFIRSAREYDAAGQVVRLWENGFFLETFEVLAILDLIADASLGSGVEVLYWTGQQDDGTTPSKRSVAEANDDVMRQPGDPTPDPLLQGPDYPMLQPRAAFQRPRDHDADPDSEIFFFTANQFLRMRVTPGATDDVLLLGPQNVLGGWPALKEAGFAKVDAVLPVPGRDDQLYFFSQDKYAKIMLADAERTQDASLVGVPHKITDKWPSLREAGFDKVDAVLPRPNSNDAYFFSGDRYAVIHVVPGTTDDHIVSGPHVITNYWPSLRKAGFSTVDVAFLNPKDTDQAYFLSGDQYVRVMVKPGTTDDSLIDGPKKVADYWRPLREAAFYR